MALNLDEALAVLSTFGNVSYKSRAQRSIVQQARKIVDDEARKAVERETDGLCTTCWGDGFKHVPPSSLQGPCEICDGTGRRREAGNAFR